jgi:1-acyl-sn-glycerol-3-phosphate acyltransferase
MFDFLPGPFKALFSTSIFVMNTIFWTMTMVPFVILKIAIRNRKVRAACTRVLVEIAQNWISGNNLNLALLHKMNLQIENHADLKMDRSYFVCANHQSWVDIVILQRVFNRQIPFLRFFLKSELIYVPFLGGAWWALDFPFMKRHSKAYLEKHPEKRGEDLVTTRKACARFKDSRVSVLNFLEGTRFTTAKHDRQKSPFKHLLKPKTGGVAFVLDAMGEQFHSLLDVTIFYPQGPISFGGLLRGKLRHVVVQIDEIAIPRDFLGQSYLNDEAFREKLQAWVTGIWQQKDSRLEQYT